jgi:hypothetical protein
MTTPWTSYLPNVLPEVEACPLPLATWAIRDAVIRFCTESEIWQETQAPYTVTSTPVLIAFVVTAGSRVSRIVEAQISSRELAVIAPETADRLFYGWRNGVVARPEAVSQVQTDKFSVIPQPTSSSSLILTVALQPTRDSIDGPDFLFADYYETICAKAKATLMLMAGAKWSNPQQAAVYTMMFGKDARDAKDRNQNVFELRGAGNAA